MSKDRQIVRTTRTRARISIELDIETSRTQRAPGHATLEQKQANSALSYYNDTRANQPGKAWKSNRMPRLSQPATSSTDLVII